MKYEPIQFCVSQQGDGEEARTDLSYIICL